MQFKILLFFPLPQDQIFPSVLPYLGIISSAFSNFKPFYKKGKDYGCPKTEYQEKNMGLSPLVTFWYNLNSLQFILSFM